VGAFREENDDRPPLPHLEPIITYLRTPE